jgi:hypothetical protein
LCTGLIVPRGQILQLRQGARRPTHPATPNGMAMSPQPGSIPPHSNALSEHASAQITAASATAAPNNRASGLAGLNSLASRPQQAVATRSGSPSPPSGNTQKATMQPPQQTVAPSPVNKDLGKPTGATVREAPLILTCLLSHILGHSYCRSVSLEPLSRPIVHAQAPGTEAADTRTCHISSTL